MFDSRTHAGRSPPFSFPTLRFEIFSIRLSAAKENRMHTLYSITIEQTIQNTKQHNATQRNATQRNATQRNATQRNAMQRNTTQHNTTQHNKSRTI